MNSKRYKKHWFGTAVLTLALVLPLAAAAQDDIQATIEDLNAKWNEAFNNGDAAALAARYSEDAHLSPGNGTVLSGREAIQGLFQSFMDAGVHNHTIEIIDTHQAGDIAFEIANWTAQGAEKDGQKPTFGGVLVQILERNVDGEWHSRMHIWNAGSE